MSLKNICKFTYHWPKADHEFLNLACLRSVDHREVSKLLIVLCWQVKAEVVEIEYVFGLLVGFLLGVDHSMLFRLRLGFIIVQDIYESMLEYIICSIFFS